MISRRLFARGLSMLCAALSVLPTVTASAAVDAPDDGDVPYPSQVKDMVSLVGWLNTIQRPQVDVDTVANGLEYTEVFVKRLFKRHDPNARARAERSMFEAAANNLYEIATLGQGTIFWRMRPETAQGDIMFLTEVDPVGPDKDYIFDQRGHGNHEYAMVKFYCRLACNKFVETGKRQKVSNASSYRYYKEIVSHG